MDTKMLVGIFMVVMLVLSMLPVLLMVLVMLVMIMMAFPVSASVVDFNLLGWLIYHRRRNIDIRATVAIPASSVKFNADRGSICWGCEY
jgi:hypothetical protein